MNLTAKYLF